MTGAFSKNPQAFWHIAFSLFYLLLAGLTITFFSNQGKLSRDISVFDIFILFFATFRLIRLFVYDSITSYIREYFDTFDRGPQKELSMLLSCPWCTGIWMSLVVFFLYFFHPLLWYFLFLLALAGAGSYLQVIINRVSR